jgi:hypothetical protein
MDRVWLFRSLITQCSLIMYRWHQTEILQERSVEGNVPQLPPPRRTRRGGCKSASSNDQDMNVQNTNAQNTNVPVPTPTFNTFATSPASVVCDPGAQQTVINVDRVAATADPLSPRPSSTSLPSSAPYSSAAPSFAAPSFAAVSSVITTPFEQLPPSASCHAPASHQAAARSSHGTHSPLPNNSQDLAGLRIFPPTRTTAYNFVACDSSLSCSSPAVSDGNWSYSLDRSVASWPLLPTSPSLPPLPRAYAPASPTHFVHDPLPPMQQYSGR